MRQHTFLNPARRRYTPWALVLGLVALQGLQVAAASELRPETLAYSAPELRALLATMPAGDSARGAQLHQQWMCASCHGERGESVSMNWPSLLGQRPEYTYKMLRDYREGRRTEDERAQLMAVVARNLNEQQMADLASFYAGQALPAAAAAGAAEALVRQGDPARLITPCASCHGLQGQGGVNETPALAGMAPEYFERTLKGYRDGRRANDVESGMRAFAHRLTDAEISALARYYAPGPVSSPLAGR